MEYNGVLIGSEVCAAVMGRGADFLLIDLYGDIEPGRAEAARRGFVYCGLLAIKDGTPSARCEPSPDCVPPMLAAAVVFAQIHADELGPKPSDDSEAWCFRLFALEDPRG
jgi:hypothetical protein